MGADSNNNFSRCHSQFAQGTIHIPERRLAKLKGLLTTCLNRSYVLARELASITGQIITMSCAVPNLTRLLTRTCYAAIEAATHWDHQIFISPAIRYKLQFWLDNIDAINGRPMSPKSSAVAVVYSDASDTGFGGNSVHCGADLVAGNWSK